MLINLYVKNFAIIEEINVDFTPGLNIISGETGAGKSILINAISLLSGNRINKDYLGKFDDYALVEGAFTADDRIRKLLEQEDIACEDVVIVQRRFSKSSSTVKINNRMTTLNFLNDLSQSLLDIHGQHSQLVALNKSNYINIIDAFNPKTEAYKAEIKRNLEEIKKLELQKDSMDLPQEEINREIDLLKYQIDEIEAFDFDSYREDELNDEHKKLTNQTKIMEGVNSIQNFLNESSYGQKSLRDMVESVYDVLIDISEYDKDLIPFKDQIANIKEALRDLSRGLDNYYYSIDMNEQRLYEIESIFEAILNLKRKYGPEIDQIKTFLERAKTRLDRLENLDKNMRDINEKMAASDDKNRKLSEKLSQIRKEICQNLEEKIVKELSEMNMSNVKFAIEREKLDQVTENGWDKFDFLISTNKGQDMKSLSDVGSGGEISRFMLALKAVLADYEKVQTIVFDEIDSGISGKTANVVGQKLKKISNYRQLIVITHLAQIASFGKSHYLIEKENIGKNTVSKISKLNDKERVLEVARLISGKKLTDLSVSSAKELIDLNR